MSKLQSNFFDRLQMSDETLRGFSLSLMERFKCQMVHHDQRINNVLQCNNVMLLYEADGEVAKSVSNLEKQRQM